MRNVDSHKAVCLLILLIIQACNLDDDPGRIASPGNIETFAGLGPPAFGYEGDGGTATSAKLGYVTGIAVDNLNNVYFTDGAANTVRKISASNGVIITIAGTFMGFNVVNNTTYAGDGNIATAAHLNVPLATSVDGSGNVIIADAGNNAIRQISSADGKIFTLAGKGPGFSGYDGDGGPATQSRVWNPYSVAVDVSGNIYIADSQNNVIRMINKSTGKITTIAGLGPSHPGYSGDNGAATLATLNGPQGVVVDVSGNIYIADSGNNVIRKISAGVISTIAGTGSEGYSGDNGPAIAATFLSVKGLAVDAENNIYIADSGNNVIRMISISTGEVSTVAGNGAAGYSGDGGNATEAELSNPLGVALDSNGNIYIADSQNSVIRVVSK